MPLREKPVAASHVSRSQVQICEEVGKPRVVTSLQRALQGVLRELKAPSC